MRALICGISGQDGAYLAKLLLSKGYHVTGTSRDANGTSFHRLDTLGIREKIELLSMDVSDFRSILNVVSQQNPQEIYNLSGQSSVSLSFEQPVEAMKSIAMGTLNILEVIRFYDASIRFYSASSGECFGDVVGNSPAQESTAFRPGSPYGVAKAAAFFLVQNYRLSYGLHASSGLLFNHESPLRPERFVTQKVVSAAAQISKDPDIRLKLGNLSIARDWGWAPDYVDAMWLMLQQDLPDDYVVATGETILLQQFVERSFAFFDLDWRQHVDHDDLLTRPSEITVSRGCPDKASSRLGWRASMDINGVIKEMCGAARLRLALV